MFAPFARDVMRPEVASAFERFAKPPYPFIEDSVPDLHHNYGTFLKQHRGPGDSGDTFKLFMNVSQFEPREVTIKRVDDVLVIQARHEMKPDEHGYVSREFTRRIEIPDDVDVSSIKPVFNKNGVLTIQGLRKTPVSKPGAGITIPVKIQKPVEMMPEDDAALERDKETSPTGTEYIVREVL